LFGSAARGDGNVDSDLDVLVIHEDAVDPDRWADQLAASGRAELADSENAPEGKNVAAGNAVAAG
jgi:predicted nucleotidyltransferase